MDQFFCVELLLGKEKLKKIRQASVTIVGIGAVGSYAVEALARAGVGRMRLVDFDKIKSSNLNRHILALRSTIGQSKASLAAQRVKDINPSCAVDLLESFAAQESFGRILDNGPDLVIDAIDSLSPKAQLISACYRRKIPIISSMGAATRLDPLSLRVADLLDTKSCPLARQLRGKLKKEGLGRGIICVYSEEPRNKRAIDTNNSNSEDDYKRGRPRSKLGSLPTITGIFGLTVAHIALEKLCGGFKNK
ncbi:MAG TPA: tRNA threonylcarbamoyladenosine dehydratase [Candidatus Omnitrophota bacterium]|nr:tRNA threonylcarbamoyladenosine dehydratase [Candidatus Omnitrophota bacterium]